MNEIIYARQIKDDLDPLSQVVLNLEKAAIEREFVVVKKLKSLYDATRRFIPENAVIIPTDGNRVALFYISDKIIFFGISPTQESAFKKFVITASRELDLILSSTS